MLLDLESRQIASAEVTQLSSAGGRACRIAGCSDILSDEAYLYDQDSNEVMVLPLKASPEQSDDGSLTVRAHRLSDRGIFSGFSGKLLPLGHLQHRYFEVLREPPTLVAATRLDELEVHSIAMGSMLRIAHPVDSIAALAKLQVSSDAWCLVSMADSGRTTLFKGREDRAKEALLVDKSVFDTGLGAWDPEEPEQAGHQSHFDCMCVQQDRKRVIIAARKVAGGYADQRGHRSDTACELQSESHGLRHRDPRRHRPRACDGGARRHSRQHGAGAPR